MVTESDIFAENCNNYQFFFSQMLCQSWMRSIILKNVSPSHEMVTHHLGTTFGDENLESRAFLLVILLRY
jgi:hypothetical protein